MGHVRPPWPQHEVQRREYLVVEERRKWLELWEKEKADGRRIRELRAGIQEIRRARWRCVARALALTGSMEAVGRLWGVPAAGLRIQLKRAGLPTSVGHGRRGAPLEAFRKEWPGIDWQRLHDEGEG